MRTFKEYIHRDRERFEMIWIVGLVLLLGAGSAAASRSASSEGGGILLVLLIIGGAITAICYGWALLAQSFLDSTSLGHWLWLEITHLGYKCPRGTELAYNGPFWFAMIMYIVSGMVYLCVPLIVIPVSLLVIIVGAANRSATAMMAGAKIIGISMACFAAIAIFNALYHDTLLLNICK